MGDPLEIQTVQDRLSRLKELTEFTENCKNQLNDMFKTLGWSMDYKQAEMYDHSICYENSSVRTFTMDKSTQHQVILQARSAAPLMRMEGVFWQGQYSGQPVDVPQNHKRAVCDLTVADRLALYDHVVSQRKEAASSSNEDLYVDLVSKLQKEFQSGEVMHTENLNVSANASTLAQTNSVIREVINVHSDELARQWREDEDESTRSEHSSHRYKKRYDL
ncbi:U11/U12 small nuclear ribonucleoprotein 48 kDa protein-like [Seriola lalandi dorsalis]|uniref:U11/U12 small nuclear ribonucleoprotein 48 kDa protein-like n=1 Tax=Seriola lalandi dorsalis TaxID=1841481 RepID=UPI000C6F8AA2|nr:U11/U12 small nuclear ribonucleoprotein 48 kDa protein-like [Seriola lalandi dorsalis]